MKKLLTAILCLTVMLALGGCVTQQETKNEERVSPETTDSGMQQDNTGEAADTKTEADKEKGKIGALLSTLSLDFQIQMSNGIQRAAVEAGYEYMPYDYNSDSEGMVSGIETLMASGVTSYYGLFLAPETAAGLMTANPEVGVLTQGEVVTGAQACTQEDWKALADKFVDALDYFVKETGITKGDVAGLWLTSCEVEDSDYFRAREEMTAIINEYLKGTDFKFAADYYPNDGEEASNMTTSLLNGYPDVRFIFCFNNDTAIACANEISSAVTDVSDYFIFSSEGDDETFRLINDPDSPLRACTYMNIEESGYQVGRQLINWNENGTMENVFVERNLVDARNITEFVK